MSAIGSGWSPVWCVLYYYSRLFYVADIKMAFKKKKILTPPKVQWSSFNVYFIVWSRITVIFSNLFPLQCKFHQSQSLSTCIKWSWIELLTLTVFLVCHIYSFWKMEGSSEKEIFWSSKQKEGLKWLIYHQENNLWFLNQKLHHHLKASWHIISQKILLLGISVLRFLFYYYFVFQLEWILWNSFPSISLFSGVTLFWIQQCIM